MMSIRDISEAVSFVQDVFTRLTSEERLATYLCMTRIMIDSAPDRERAITILVQMIEETNATH